MSISGLSLQRLDDRCIDLTRAFRPIALAGVAYPQGGIGALVEYLPRSLADSLNQLCYYFHDQEKYVIMIP
jgi:hypothetical protein